MPRDCITCDGPNCANTGPTKRCSRCHTVYYCSVDCQKKNWKDHKRYCLDINSMRNEVDLKSFSKEIASPDVTPINTECCICLGEPIQDPVTLKSCRHAFCSACLIEWQRQKPQGQTPTCPNCRGESENVEDDAMEHARLLGGRANRWDIEKRFDEANNLRRQVLRDLENITDKGNEPHLQALLTMGEIQLKFDPEGALKTFDRVISTDNERHKRLERVQKLMSIADAARERGTVDEETERKLEELWLNGKVGLSCLPGAGPTRHVFVNLLRGEAFEAMKKWTEAKEIYFSILTMEEFFDGSTPQQQRAVWMGLSKCAFHLGVYDKSIGAADAALEMNRHYPDVHKYKALSLKSLGKLDQAVDTMNRAVLYETPWDDRLRAEVLELYEELKNECE